MSAIEHNPVCNCQECEKNLRMAAAMEYADRYYELRRRQIKAAAERMELATVIRFPIERRFRNGER